MLGFEVVDTGIGIDPQTLATLFEPFVQAESDTTRRFGGTGLGLAICRRLAGLMGGEIRTRSRKGEGPSFTLLLPVRLASAAEQAALALPGAGTAPVRRLPRQAASVAQARERGTLILIVDDHPTNRRLALRQVNVPGHAAEVAENGVEALQRFQRGRYGLVLSNCHRSKRPWPNCTATNLSHAFLARPGISERITAVSARR